MAVGAPTLKEAAEEPLSSAVAIPAAIAVIDSAAVKAGAAAVAAAAVAAGVGGCVVWCSWCLCN